MHLEPHDYYYVNIDLHHQFEFLLEFLYGISGHRRLSVPRGMEKGETAVFTGYNKLCLPTPHPPTKF